MSWSFGLINGKLAEIFFDKIGRGVRFRGHAFVDKKDYTTKKEQKWIESDTKKVKLIYKDSKYKKTDSLSMLEDK